MRKFERTKNRPLPDRVNLLAASMYAIGNQDVAVAWRKVKDQNGPYCNTTKAI